MSGEDMTQVYSADWVLPMSSSPIADGAIAVCGNRIVDVGPRQSVLARQRGGSTTRLDGSIIMPGLVNGHAHLTLTRFYEERSFDDLLDLMRAAGEYCRSVGRDQLDAGCRSGQESCIRNGVTSVVDWRHSGLLPCDYDAPLRKIIAFEVIGPRPASASSRARWLSRRLREFERNRPPAARAAVGLHSPYMVSWTLWGEALRVAGRKRLPVMTHLSETHSELSWVRTGRGALVEHCRRLSSIARPRRSYHTPVELLFARRQIPEGAIVVHGTHLTPSDRRLLARKRAYICQCPSSNLRYGRRLPLHILSDASDRIMLGCDSLSARHDLLAEARILLNRCANKGNEHQVAKAILNACTIAAASALGLAGQIGSLHRGALADWVEVAIPGRWRAHELESAVIRVGETRRVMFNGECYGGGP